MSQITDRPNEYDFGYDFDYANWTENTEVTLVNVPWGNDYRDVLEGTTAGLNAWIDAQTSHTLTYGNMTHITPGMPVKLPEPLNKINKFNYIRVRNGLQPIAGDESKDYFYFVLDMRRVNASVTEVVLQLDVWASFRNNVVFHRGFVERSHLGIAATNAGAERGRQYLTTPEGFDTGTDYSIAVTEATWQLPGTGWALITTAVDLTEDPGSTDSPVQFTAPGGYLQDQPTATTTYAVRKNRLEIYFAAMRNYPWVTQGIIRVVLAPNLDSMGAVLEAVPRENNYPPGEIGASDSWLHIVDHAPISSNVNFSADSLQGAALNNLPSRYTHLKKFGISPYTMLEVSNEAGSSGTYRPELFSDGDSDATIFISLIPGAERAEFVPRYYNNSGFGLGEYFESSVVTGAFPTLPVVNDMAISALASSAHSRTASRQSASWAQNIALDSAANAYDGAALSASTSQGNDAIMRTLSENVQEMDQEAARREQMWSMGTSVVSGAVGGGLLKGGPAGAGLGAAAGLAKGVMERGSLMRAQETDRNRLSATNAAAANISTRNFNTATTLNESNKGLADRAARGNYEQAIGAMNAQVQDTALTQPGVSGGYGGEFMRYMANGFVFTTRVRMIGRAAIETIGEHWLRYGYALRTFAKLPASLLVMNKFTYWKVSEVYTSTAPIPELYKRTLMGIMEKGVTVWANPDDIGMIDIATNAPKTGVKIER